jgi:MYXO-CTERM domain-containing protein
MMTRPARRFAPLVLSAFATFAALAVAREAQAASDTYTFRDKLSSVEGGASGNVLAFEYNNGDATPGTFVDTTIDANACANTPTVRGYSFPQYSGFKSLNKTPIVATESYTITMIVKFNPLQGAFTRLIDFSDSTLDEGIYVLNGEISFYPVGTFAPGAFLDNQYSVVTLTRDAASSVVSLYIGLTPAGTYTDTMKIYVPANGTLHFFMDNTTGPAPIAESSAGIVTFVRVSDTPTTLAGLAASIGAACQAVACGNAKLEPGEGCDDGNDAAGDGCSKTCKIENGFACVSSDAGNDAYCASGHCDTATSTCLAVTAADAGPEDAGPEAAIPDDAGQADAAIPATADAGPPATEPMPSSGGCGCEVGPRQSRAPALGLLVAGIVVALRLRRDKRMRGAKRGSS